MNRPKTVFAIVAYFFLSVSATISVAGDQSTNMPTPNANIHIYEEANACDSESVGTVINCLSAKSRILDSQIEQIYKTHRAALEKRKGSKVKLERDTATEIDRRLVDSQDAWRRFAESECSLIGSEFLGGTYKSLLYFDCRVKKAEDRLRVLRNLSVE